MSSLIMMLTAMLLLGTTAAAAWRMTPKRHDYLTAATATATATTRHAVSAKGDLLLLLFYRRPYIADDSLTTKRLVQDLQQPHRQVEGMDATELGYDKSTTTTTTTNLRGMFAKQDFEKGEYLCAVPFPATLVIEETLEKKDDEDEDESEKEQELASNIDPDVSRGLLFLENFAIKEEWRPYIDCLPTATTLDPSFDPTPDFWPEDVIQELQVPRLVQESLCRKRDIIRLAAAKNNCADESSFSVKDLQWATWVVRSRGFTTFKMVTTTTPEGQPRRALRTRKVLIPYLDMLNHPSDDDDDGPNCEMQIVESSCDEESFYALQAIKPIAAGESATIAYGMAGRESCLDLFGKYGFWTKNNPADEYLDWENAVQPCWTTTLQQDEELLNEMENSRNNDDPLRTVVSLRIHLKRLQQRFMEER